MRKFEIIALFLKALKPLCFVGVVDSMIFLSPPCSVHLVGQFTRVCAELSLEVTLPFPVVFQAESVELP